MATRKRADNGGGNGDDNGENNGSGLLEFDDFVEAVRPELGALNDKATCTEPDREGRPFGKRLGSIALSPLETLDDRLAEEWPGPRTIVIRTRKPDGTLAAFVGRLSLGAPRASSATPATPEGNALVAMLLSKIDKLEAAQAAQQQSAPPKLGEQVSALDSLAGVLQKIVPQQQAAPASSMSDLEKFEKFMEFTKKHGGGGAVASIAEPIAAKVIDAFKDSGNDLVRAVGAALGSRAMKNAAEIEEREAAAISRKLADKRALREEFGDYKKDDEEKTS